MDNMHIGAQAYFSRIQCIIKTFFLSWYFKLTYSYFKENSEEVHSLEKKGHAMCNFSHRYINIFILIMSIVLT